MTKPVLVNIVGSTASGKTAVAIALAKRLHTEIVSADSRQVYREMKTGTAFPEEDELKAVRHHLLGHKSIFDPYSVKDFEREALEVLERLFRERPFVIMTGGTGLYFHAVNYGLDEMPEVPSHIRDELRTQWEREGLEPLLEELKNTDPAYYRSVDRQNPVRVLRALEVIRHTGKPFSSFRTGRPKERFFHAVWFGLDWPRDLLYERINRRVDIMLEKGLEEEARALYPYRHLQALQTVGYREWFDFFDGKINRERAVEEIKKNTRRYAKRQRTWFRKNKSIVWLDGTKPAGELAAEIENLLRRHKKAH